MLARSVTVDRTCDQLLTAPGFSRDQHRGVCRRHRLYSFQYLDDGAAVPYDLFEVMFLADFFLQIDVLSLELLLQGLDLTKSRMQFCLGVLAFQFGGRPRGKDFDHFDGLLVQIFASRAAAELKRQHAETELHAAL